MCSNLGTAERMAEGRKCSPAGSYGGIPGELEGSESGGVPEPGAPGSEDCLGRGKRMRITCRLSWISLQQESHVALTGMGAAAGSLGPGSLPQPGVGPWAARWCSYWGSPVLSCGMQRTVRHVKELGLTQQ